MIDPHHITSPITSFSLVGYISLSLFIVRRYAERGCYGKSSVRPSVCPWRWDRDSWSRRL